jgi:hypothetical protein
MWQFIRETLIVADAVAIYCVALALYGPAVARNEASDRLDDLTAN